MRKYKENDRRQHEDQTVSDAKNDQHFYYCHKNITLLASQN